MTYKHRNDLPDQVKNTLPTRAQEIYLNAYNNAWEQYKEPKKRQGDEGREETAHKVAWSAVKNKFKKGSDDQWHQK